MPPLNQIKGHANPRLLTYQPSRMPEVFLVWKAGSRSPRSFHLSHAEALAEARAFVQPGEEVCVLRTEVVAHLRAELVLHDDARSAASV